MSIDDIRAREQAATEGPWDRLDAQIRHTKVDARVRGRRAAHEQTERDIQFVMNARTDIPKLLDVLDAVLAEHKPMEWAFVGVGPIQACETCAAESVTAEQAQYPCPTVRAITEALR